MLRANLLYVPLEIWNLPSIQTLLWNAFSICFNDWFIYWYLVFCPPHTLSLPLWSSPPDIAFFVDYSNIFPWITALSPLFIHSYRVSFKILFHYSKYFWKNNFWKEWNLVVSQFSSSVVLKIFSNHFKAMIQILSQLLSKFGLISRNSKCDKEGYQIYEPQLFGTKFVGKH